MTYMRKRKHKPPKKAKGNPWPVWLSALREANDLSQEEAAARVDANVATWRGWEYGRRRPSPLTQKLLRLTFADFFRGK